MPSKKEYIIIGPPMAEPPSPTTLQKSLSIRRDPRVISNNIRDLYRDSATFDEDGSVDRRNSIHTSQNLPPTPPRGSSEHADTKLDESSSDAAIFRSTLVTPVNQQNPPTPDNTPPRDRDIPLPRPFLGAQTSFTSTRAESFKTAREEILTDDETDLLTRGPDRIGRIESIPSLPLNGVYRPHPSGLSKTYTPDTVNEVSPVSPMSNSNAQPQYSTSDYSHRDQIGRVSVSPKIVHHLPNTSIEDRLDESTIRERSIHGDGETSTAKLVDSNHTSPQATSTQLRNVVKVRRGPSLRERLAEAQQNSASASTEKFASIIGWNNSVPPDISQDERRLSTYSATSTIDAFVVVQSTPVTRTKTLRHIAKNDSLRSVSSPLPVSNRTSLNSSSDSPHRLVHKKAKLSNQNRWSFGSEASRSFSMSSIPVHQKPEVIRVAVIPERSSSLNRSASSSKSASISTRSGKNHSRKVSENPPSSWQHRRTASESAERGRERQRLLVVPPRSSSLSAPTSRSTSRAGSVTSDNVRIRRLEAETDLRKTLDKMESERLASSFRDLSVDASDSQPNQYHRPSIEVTTPVQHNPGAKNVQTPTTGLLQTTSAWSPDSHVFNSDHPSGNIVPGSEDWAALRPTSYLATPFSQPSFQSASPEIVEARAVNFFPHNNHSLQLIEPNPLQESLAVREVRKHKIDPVESPLRNPRQPPEPPKVQFLPPSPTALHAGDENEYGIVPIGLERTSTGDRNSNSLMNSLARNLSLKTARNRKANQDLDGNLHPFWRPHAFWDDEGRDQSKRESQDRSIGSPGLINNSLGLPQERTVVTGPLSLVRRISERRRQNRELIKKSSHGSLARIRASRQLHKASGLGFHLRFIGLRDIQDRLLFAKQRKEEERREARRAALRESIGPNVISKSDSRFPASDASLVRS